MKITATILLLLPIVSVAQSYQGMNEKDMQRMMQQMQAMQSCMQNIDQTEMQELEQRSRRMEAEISSLCAQGKRDEAQNRAMSYGLEMAKNQTVQELGECSKMMKGAIPNMPYMVQHDRDRSSQHVCD